MTIVNVGAAVVAAFIAGWLGFYLLARDPQNPLLWSSGSGLLAYAVSLSATALRAATADPLPFWAAVQRATLLLPLLFWLGTLLFMLPETHSWRARLAGAWRLAILPTALIVVVAAPWLFRAGQAWAPAVIPLLLLFGGAGLALNVVLLQAWRGETAGIPTWLVPTATLFYLLGLSLILLPILPLPEVWLHVALAVDLLVLGVAVGALNAFADAESLRFDMLRSFSSAALASTIIGGQIVLVMIVSTGLTTPMVGLLLAVCATIISWQRFEPQLARLLDRLLLPLPGLPDARAALRETAAALPRRRQTGALDLDPADFERATRRALSRLGDLPRLAANPLTRLPQVDRRLNSQLESGPLARAAALQAILTDRIEQLRPPGEDDFGTTDAWRHYNALYYPYVVGLRPYRRRPVPDPETLSSTERFALDWFQEQVPERTLYNWQKAASRLIARDLRAEAERVLRPSAN